MVFHLNKDNNGAYIKIIKYEDDRKQQYEKRTNN